MKIKKILSAFVLSGTVFFVHSENFNGLSLEHNSSDKNSPVVYFTSDISSEGLMKVYRALNQKIEGKVGIKVSYGAPDEQYLNPQLLKDLVQITDGTFMDSNGLSGNRWTSNLNLALAKTHGFTDVGKTIMLDGDNIDMPVKDGYYLTYARTSKPFDEFSTMIAVHRFKMHYIVALGGNIKNITLCLGNRSGKCLIHSGGTDENHYHSTEPEVLQKSYVDAAKAVLSYKKNWAFINVLDSFEPDDNCDETENVGNIGIIASNDVVAIDQCSVDLYLAKSNASQKSKNDWCEYHQVDVLKYAEESGIGKRNYQLVNLD